MAELERELGRAEREAQSAQRRVDKAASALERAREKEAEYLPLIAQVEPIKVVVSIARENYGKLPMAVASGGTGRIILQVLKYLAIRNLFGAIVTSEDVVNQKPAPDIFLEAARRIGVPPQCCRAYEDTELGLLAIRAAGMEAVDVRELVKNHPPCGVDSP